MVFCVCFIGWRPASCVFHVCFVSGAWIWAFPADKRVSGISDTSPCLGKSSRGVRGAARGPGGGDAGACAPRSRVQARAPRAPSTASGKARSGGGDPATAHGWARTLPSLALCIFGHGQTCDGFECIQNNFSSAILSWRRVPEPHFRQTSTSPNRRRFKGFLCGPKSNSFDARSKIWVNSWKRVRVWGWCL